MKIKTAIGALLVLFISLAATGCAFYYYDRDGYRGPKHYYHHYDRDYDHDRHRGDRR